MDMVNSWCYLIFQSNYIFNVIKLTLSALNSTELTVTKLEHHEKPKEKDTQSDYIFGN